MNRWPSAAVALGYIAASVIHMRDGYVRAAVVTVILSFIFGLGTVERASKA